MGVRGVGGGAEGGREGWGVLEGGWGVLDGGEGVGGGVGGVTSRVCYSTTG